jgi:hypothetical protein
MLHENCVKSVLLLLQCLSLLSASVAHADDVDLMENLIDTVQANKGMIRTWKGTAMCEYEREDVRDGKTYAEKSKQSIEFVLDALRERVRSKIVVDEFEVCVDGVKGFPLPDNSACMIKDGTYYDFFWKSPDKEGTVIVEGKPVEMKGSELTPMFRTLPEIPQKIERSSDFFHPLARMDYEFRDFTADFEHLLSKLEEDGRRNLVAGFDLREKDGIFVFSRTISEGPNEYIKQKRVHTRKRTFDLNKGGLLIESSRVTKEENGEIVSERTAKTIPQEVDGVWIPKERIETISEPDCKLNYRLSWTENDINVPVDEEFTFAKMGVERGSTAIDLKTGEESLVTGDDYVAPEKPKESRGKLRIMLLLVSGVVLMLIVVRVAYIRRRKGTA